MNTGQFFLVKVDITSFYFIVAIEAVCFVEQIKEGNDL